MTVQNIGASIPPSSNLRYTHQFYLSSSPILTQSTLLGVGNSITNAVLPPLTWSLGTQTWNIPLPSNQSYTQSFTATLPADVLFITGNNSYYVYVIANANNDIFEYQGTSNNFAVGANPLWYYVSSDIADLSVSVPSAGFPISVIS